MSNVEFDSVFETESVEVKPYRPRLKTLIVSNFRGIGNKPVTIELDKIVVLVGPNNVGKSSVLRAYELAMSEGSKEAELQVEDFPNGRIDGSVIPEIQLHTVVHDNAPGARWISIDSLTGEKVVMERWRWKGPGAPKRQGFDTIVGDWVDEVPWGAANIANSYRPKPHRVDAFSNPTEQAQAIIKLLTDAVKERVKAMQQTTDEESEYSKLLSSIKRMRTMIIEQSNEHIEKVENEVSDLLGEVFPGYRVKFDPHTDDEVEKDITIFNKLANAQLLMGPNNGGHLSTIDRQGSGARRTLLWSALRFIAESSQTQKVEAKQTKKNSKSSDDGGLSNLTRPHVLLLDEPELCLHPIAIRDACRVLYDLPSTDNWQVMVTTHSPAFIDVSRDNTTIVRVERQNDEISGTTVFRPSRVQLDDDDRINLKMLNIFDPHVAEFFFGGRSIIVEGDTEYTAFKYIMALNPDKYKDVHIIRARGKATIVSLVKILNHFGSGYSVLHDSDVPTITRKHGYAKNPAWAHNSKILEAVQNHPGNANVRLLASIPNFENAYFGNEVTSEKPYNAFLQLQSNPIALQTVEQLLDALLDHSISPPDNVAEWSDIKQLEEYVAPIDLSVSQVAGSKEKTK